MQLDLWKIYTLEESWFGMVWTQLHCPSNSPPHNETALLILKSVSCFAFDFTGSRAELMIYLKNSFQKKFHPGDTYPQRSVLPDMLVMVFKINTGMFGNSWCMQICKTCKTRLTAVECFLGPREEGLWNSPLVFSYIPGRTFPLSSAVNSSFALEAGCSIVAMESGFTRMVTQCSTTTQPQGRGDFVLELFSITRGYWPLTFRY